MIGTPAQSFSEFFNGIHEFRTVEGRLAIRREPGWRVRFAC